MSTGPGTTMGKTWLPVRSGPTAWGSLLMHWMGLSAGLTALKRKIYQWMRTLQIPTQLRTAIMPMAPLRSTTRSTRSIRNTRSTRSTTRSATAWCTPSTPLPSGTRPDSPTGACCSTPPGTSCLSPSSRCPFCAHTPLVAILDKPRLGKISAQSDCCHPAHVKHGCTCIWCILGECRRSSTGCRSIALGTAALAMSSLY